MQHRYLPASLGKPCCVRRLREVSRALSIPQGRSIFIVLKLRPIELGVQFTAIPGVPQIFATGDFKLTQILRESDR